MLKWLTSWFKKEPEIKPSTPENTRIYAIGDVHGRYDLLTQLHQAIAEDRKTSQAKRHILLYVGDYIDRGLESKQVVDALTTSPLEGFEHIFLKGNHEDALLRFLENPEGAAAWLAWGGDATLRSYGVRLHNEKGKRRSETEMATQLATTLPESHRHFFESLKLHHQEGDYFFVHAGLRPGKELEAQTAEDMMTIREPFILSSHSFPFTIVFGHTIFNEPYQQAGRIGIDTGAYGSGKLTCLVLEGTEQRFLHTS